MGLRNKIPRPEHPLAASPEERIAYQRKAKKELEASGRDASRIVFEDEGHVQALKSGHAMMLFKGVQPTRKSSAGRARLTLFVVVGEGSLSSRRATLATRSTAWRPARGRAGCSARPA